MAIITSINISDKKYEIKMPVGKCKINEIGIVGDAHAGAVKRQISLLADEAIKEFSEKTGRQFLPGEFAENIITQGIELQKIPIGEQIKIGDAILEVTQVGEKCQGDQCAIFRELEKCVMPGNGIFCRVISGGEIKTGDSIKLINGIFVEKKHPKLTF